METELLSQALLFPTMDLENVPSSINEYFSPAELAVMSDYEKESLSNLRHYYETFSRAGLPVQPPDFMMKHKTERQKAPALFDSSDGSDSEWTPALKKVKTHRANTKHIFKPPMTVCPEDGPIEELNMPRSSKPKKKRKAAAESDEDVSNMSVAFPDDDDFLYCDDCNQDYDGDCPVHGPLFLVQDAKVPPTCTKNSSEYCRQTLPEGLVIKKSKIPKAGLGVFAAKDFPARTRFGPYIGKKESNEEIAHESGYSWLVMKDGQTSHFVDARDPSHSNWMRFVNCARHEDEQCVTAYQYQGDIYYRSHRQILAGAEILVYYGDSYAKDLGSQAQMCSLFSRSCQGLDRPDVHGLHADSNKTYSCGQCQLSFSEMSYLQRHTWDKHKDTYWQLQQHKIQADPLTETLLKHSQGKTRVGLADKQSERNGLALIEAKEVAQCGGNGCQKSVINNMVVGSSSGLALANGHYRELNQVLNVAETSTRLDESVVSDERYLNIKPGVAKIIREKPYKCDVCSAAFTVSGHLKTHKRIHTGEKPYKCDVCSAAFNKSGYLKIHKRIHTGEKPYKCDVCSAAFTQSANLKTHKQLHTGDKPYKCDVCSAAFNQNENLKRHKRIHTGEKPYKCDVCSAAFNRSSYLKTHKRIHTGEKPYKCDVCSAAFTVSGHLKIHKLLHTGEKPYKCDVCSAAFNQSDTLKTHKRIHTGEKPYKCDVCSAAFNKSCHLKTHKLLHTEEKPYKCDVCSAAFNRSDTLKKHKRIHTEEKPYKCDVCSAAFNQSDTLKTHKRIHTGEKPYKCDVCSAAFNRSDTLKTHKRIHAGEKPYKCDVCSAAFTVSSNLKTHKRIHTGEKPYKCDVCSAAFNQSASLKTHKRIHTGEKPYKCDVCSAAFNRSETLETHKRIHHGEF